MVSLGYGNEALTAFAPQSLIRRRCKLSDSEQMALSLITRRRSWLSLIRSRWLYLSGAEQRAAISGAEALVKKLRSSGGNFAVFFSLLFGYRVELI